MSKYTALQEQTMEDVRERYMQGGYDNKYFTDEIHEIVDSNVPIYNTELLEEVVHYDSLSDHGLLPKNPDIYDFARVTIYEGLCEVAYEAFNEVEQEYKEMIEELDDLLEACEYAQEDYDHADEAKRECDEAQRDLDSAHGDEDDEILQDLSENLEDAETELQEFSRILADAERELADAIKEYEEDGWEIPPKYVRG